MKTITPAAILICFFLLPGNAALSQLNMYGTITDTTGKPLMYVSVAVLRNKNFLTGTTSDEKGAFRLSYTWEPGIHYTLRVTLVGYQPVEKDFVYTDTGFMHHLVMVQSRQTLAGVTVTAKAPLVIRKTDRYIVNVENSYLADGNSALEVLGKSPGVWVDNNGTIRIRGSQAAMVMINDVVQHMSADELADYLKTLKSEDISRIEIIQNPPSEFEAAGAGGIVHIILKKARKDGLNGSVYASYRYQGKRPYTSPGVSANYKSGRWYLTTGYAFSKDLRDIKETAAIAYPGNSFYNNRTNRMEDVANHQYRLGIVYDITAKQSVGIQTIQNNTRFLQYYTTAIQFDKAGGIVTGTNIADKRRNFGYGSTTLNFIWKTDTLGSLVKVIADYTGNNKTEADHFRELYNDTVLNTIYRVNLPFVTDNYSMQADYTGVMKNKITLKGGVKYSSIERDNIVINENFTGNQWINDSTKTNRFIYKENLLMFYASLEKAIRKTSIQAGLRAEQTFSRGNSVTLDEVFIRRYFGLFPSLFISHALNEQKGNSIHINYSRRLTRPGLQNLNPFRVQYNNYTSLTGNPRLLPQYTHNIGAGIRLLENYSADLFITKTENVITLSANPGINNSIEYISENVHTSMDYGVDLNAMTTVLEGWTINNGFSLVHTSYHFNEQRVRRASYSIRSVHTILLKDIVDIDAEAEYRSPYTYSNIDNPSSFSFDIGFTKRVFKKNGGLRLYVSDVFNTLREKEITHIDGTTILFYRKRQTRGVTLSFTWNFNKGKKFNTNKIEQGNNEERGRIGS